MWEAAPGGKWEIEKRVVCHRRGTKAYDSRFMGTKGTARVGAAEKKYSTNGKRYAEETES